ncbi:uncharacterized protein LOC123523513 [Mercenaria mercenaria]|uniref:uncharacterized protein LOC123523513 n=1 Tax=Mercenaria mercenaria TaxID=6596 RepID=UPI00234F0E4A|nr:uncharacterized protein LOC123523513 [Mercenaria mercenaria]
MYLRINSSTIHSTQLSSAPGPELCYCGSDINHQWAPTSQCCPPAFSSEVELEDSQTEHNSSKEELPNTCVYDSDVDLFDSPTKQCKSDLPDSGSVSISELEDISTDTEFNCSCNTVISGDTLW